MALTPETFAVLARDWGLPVTVRPITPEPAQSPAVKKEGDMTIIDLVTITKPVVIRTFVESRSR